MRRRPKMSPRRPPVTSSTAKLSVYALTVHSRLERLAPRSFWIDGSATFTTVLSSMIMNRAKHMAASVHHLRLPSCRRRRSGMAEPRDLVASDDGGEGFDEVRTLLVRERRDEAGDAGDTQVGEPVDERHRFCLRAYRLEAAVGDVLAARDEAAVNEGVDRPAR